MLISLSWLKKYVQIPDDTKDFVEDLTMAGLNVERTIEEGYSDPAIVVGHVLEVSDHPDADKLRVCRVKVDADSERVIVCGAPNVGAGQDVLVALPGAQLPDGMKIRRAKIRGVKSDGMICSEQELGLGSDASGIMVLDGDFSPGTPMTEVLPPPDTVLEIEVTPNRPDQLSHIGVISAWRGKWRRSTRPPSSCPTAPRRSRGRRRAERISRSRSRTAPTAPATSGCASAAYASVPRLPGWPTRSNPLG
jgi:phenylalanyl-tRNA synthetase beta chain